MENLVDPDRKLPGADAIELRLFGVESALHPQNLQRPFQLGTVVELESRHLDRAFNLIENYVVPWVIEAARVLQRRVVDDGGIAPASNLPEYLHNERRLACTGVGNDLHMLRLGLRRDANQLR